MVNVSRPYLKPSKEKGGASNCLRDKDDSVLPTLKKSRVASLKVLVILPREILALLLCMLAHLCIRSRRRLLNH